MVVISSICTVIVLSKALICDSKAFIELMDIESTRITESFIVLAGGKNP